MEIRIVVNNFQQLSKIDQDKIIDLIGDITNDWNMLTVSDCDICHCNKELKKLMTGEGGVINVCKPCEYKVEKTIEAIKIG